MFGFESIVIYVIFWWLILFFTMPCGVSRDKKVIHGNDPGAPTKTLLKKKILITSFVSLILTVIFSIVKNEIF